jgi:trehalose 6-phosphate phosphatase
VEGAWVEDKGASLAVHYRQSPDPERAERVLRVSVADLAGRHDLSVLPGRMVLELAPTSTPGKGAVILREARTRELTACLYAGDDVADLEAFAALDALREQGVASLKVAVRSDEAPGILLGTADLVVDGPRGLLALLHTL